MIRNSTKHSVNIKLAAIKLVKVPLPELTAGAYDNLP